MIALEREYKRRGQPQAEGGLLEPLVRRRGRSQVDRARRLCLGQQSLDYELNQRSCPFFHEGSKFVASEWLHLLCILHGHLLPTCDPSDPPCVHPITGTLPTLEQIEVETITRGGRSVSCRTSARPQQGKNLLHLADSLAKTSSIGPLSWPHLWSGLSAALKCPVRASCRSTGPAVAVPGPSTVSDA